jgi:calcium/calmodulin-dependent protein kinase I
MGGAAEEALRREYVVGEEIGRGRFGTVRRCYAAATGEPFALKTTPKAALRADPLDLALAEQEPKVHHLASAASRHVVALHAAFVDADAVHLVLDLCAGGDLFALVSARGALPEPEAAELMAQLADALAGCHRRGVAHRDVKPDNLLFDAAAGGALRLGDFGSAAWFGDGRPMTGLVGTPYYVAPEVVAGREYTEKVDVWSAGVVLYMMLSGTVPFSGATAGEIFQAVLRGNLRFPPRAFAAVSPEAKDLLRRMLCRDVWRRLSAEQVLSKHQHLVCLSPELSAHLLTLLFPSTCRSPMDCDSRRKCAWR